MAMTGQSPCSSMSNHTRERVTMAKMTLENFYSNLIAQHEEREMRYRPQVSDVHTEFLDWQRTRLSQRFASHTFTKSPT